MRLLRTVTASYLPLFLSFAVSTLGQSEPENCTVIGVGKNATVDGSVITSQTDSSSECRVHVVPARTYEKGAKAPVHWGMVYFGPKDKNAGLELGNYGRVLAEIPQVKQTYAYFQTG